MLASSGLLLLAATIVPIASATRYAQFCDDNHCKTNCGISASITNPGCLKESGRHSVKFHGGGIYPDGALVTSPDDHCGCQNYCYDDIVKTDQATNQCTPLTGPSARSFRFVTSQSCDLNNC